MSGKKICMGVAALVLSGIGCRTVMPPTYAVANLYPVVQPASVLEDTRPCAISQEVLRAKMERFGLLSYLEDACLPEYEWETVIRSLESRGYAEIDARRTGRQLYSICIQSPDGRNLLVKAEFKPRNQGIVIDGKKFSLTQNRQEKIGQLHIRILRKFLADLSGIACYLEIREGDKE